MFLPDLLSYTSLTIQRQWFDKMYKIHYSLDITCFVMSLLICKVSNVADRKVDEKYEELLEQPSIRNSY